MALLLALGTFVITNAPNLIGFILPPFVEYLNKDVPNENARFVISLVACLLAALAVNWQKIAAGTMTQEQLVLLIGIIFTESQTIFKLYFQESWLRQKMQTALNSANSQELG